MEDKGRVESLQSHCATLLKRGESWDYIGGSLQLMAADRRAQREEQGLLDFGENFMKSLDNAARYIEKVLKGLKDAIGDQKAVKRLASGRRGENVRRGGNRVEVSRRAPEIVRALEEERARWELVGSYPDLQAEAYMWDGETEPQHAERIIERVEELTTNDAAEVATNARGEVVTNEVPEGQGAFDFSASVRGRRVYARGMDLEGGQQLAGRFHAVERGEGVVCRVEDGEYEGVTEADIYAEDSKVALGALKRIVKALATEPVTFSDGTQATVSGRTRREVQQHIADRRVIAALAKVRELAARGVYLYSAENGEREEKESKAAIVRFHYYLTRASFPGRGKDAYTVISVAEMENGERVYQLNLSNVEDVDKIKDEASALPATRVTKTGRGDASSYMDRIHETKRYVNYIDRVSQENRGDVSFSVSEARERGLFKNGVMELGNGVLVDGGADFSAAVDFSHVSPALYRRPDREHVGTGEGNAVYGWGVLYGAEHPMTNRFYHGQFTYEGAVFTRRRDGKEQDVAREDVVEGLKKKGAGKSVLNSLPHWSKYQTREALEEVRAKALKNAEFCKNLNDAEFVYAYEQRALVAEYLLENDIFVKEGIKYPVNYRMRADVDDSNLLHWDEKLDRFLEEHPDVAAAFGELLNVDFDTYFDVSARNVPTREGRLLYEQLAKKLGSARAASEWLDEHGIRGVKYEDGMSRNKEENKTYNYVIFNPDYIEVIAINNRHPWSEYSEDNPDWQKPEDVDFSASVRNLAAVHTIGVFDFLNAAEKLGGMPLPSVAVTRLDKPYRWGDDRTSVTLVARPDMVDPKKGTDVYARDAWTGRMPMIESEMDGEDLRTFFYDEEGEKVDATLENLTDYLYGRKRRGNEATEREMDLTWTARSYLARRMKDMEDVKGQRERLQSEDEVRVMSEDIGKWMNMLSERYDTWLVDNEWIGVFEALADVDEVTEESVREAIMGWTDADGRADLSALQNSEAMEEGSDFIKETVRILRELRAEKTDYLEAVPQRAVKMNEWAYALFSDKVDNKEAVRRVCRENGITPVEYKAGERDKVLRDLIDDGEVSFSVREGVRYRVVDDRVGLSEHLNDVVEPVVLNVKLTGERKDWMGEARKFFVRYLANRVLPIGETGFTLHTDGSNTPRTSAAKVTTERGARAFEKLEEVIGKAVHLGSESPQHREGETKKRRDLMDRSNSVEFFGFPLRVNGGLFLAWFNGTTKKRGKNDKEEPDQKQVRLYEVGFQPVKMKGNAPQLTDLKSDAKGVPLTGVTMAEVLQNVNEKSEWMPEVVEEGAGDVSMSMSEVDLRRRVVERLRRGEDVNAEGAEVAREWVKFCDDFGLFGAKEGERAAGAGRQMMGRMLALLTATRRVLPGARLGGLAAMARWAEWYGEMMEAGQITSSTRLSGAVYEGVMGDLKARRGNDELVYTEEEARGLFREQMGRRLDAIMLSMAQRVRERLERELKRGMREDMMATIRALYPRREAGEHWRRGRATGDTYRYAEKVREILWMGGYLASADPAHKEAKERAQNRLMRRDLTAEARRGLEEELAALEEREANELQAAYDKAERTLRDPESSEEEKARAEEDMHLLMCFGDWAHMGYAQCVRSYGEFKKVIAEGRAVWKEKMEERKAKVGYIKKRVRQQKVWKKALELEDKRQTRRAERGHFCYFVRELSISHCRS